MTLVSLSGKQPILMKLQVMYFDVMGDAPQVREVPHS